MQKSRGLNGKIFFKNEPSGGFMNLYSYYRKIRSRGAAIFEKHILYFLIKFAPWAFLPIIWIIRLAKIRFVTNIALGVGHIVPEADHFLRLKKTGAIDPNLRYVLIFQNSALAAGFCEIYRHHFFYCTSSTFLFLLTAPLLLIDPNLQVDCGLSRLKFRLPDPGDATLYPPFQQRISKLNGYRNRIGYYRLRGQIQDYLPLRSGNFEESVLEELLNYDDRIALIQIKTKPMNAAALPTNPETYLPALEYMMELGIRLVKIGYEKIPDSFTSLGMLDYPSTPQARFSNDLRLVRRASIVLATSGVGWMPCVMEVPQVYAKFWHIFTPPFSKNCIMAPTLVRRRTDDQILSFSDQFDLYINKKDEYGPELFPIDTHEPINATSDEILAAVKECLALAEKERPLSNLQRQYKMLDPEGFLAYAESRISEYFINKHSDLLEMSKPCSWGKL